MALCNAYQRGFSVGVPFLPDSVGSVHLRFMNMNERPCKIRVFLSYWRSDLLHLIARKHARQPSS